MKTKMTLPVLVLAVAIAATVVMANPFGSTRTIPMPVPGDPIPGVDVSIEQSPGGIMKGTTDDKGRVTFAKVNPGPVAVIHRCPKCAATGRQGGSFFAVGTSTGGGRSVSGTWKDTSKPFKMEMVVQGDGSQSVTVTVQFSDEPKSRVKPESDQDLSRVKGESDQVTPISGVVVTIKMSGATVATATTNPQGIVTFALNPGRYDVTSNGPSGRAGNYNTGRSNTAGIAGATVDSGALTFTATTSGMAKITVAGPGPGPKTVTMTFKEGSTQQTTNPSK